MNVTDACRRLKVTPVLLKWFTRNSPKNDGRRLVQGRQGAFSEEELTDFDAYLWEPWPSTQVPTGIQAELQLEGEGLCGRCHSPCADLSHVQVGRGGQALGYACQHPHNLIALCADCRRDHDADWSNENGAPHALAEAKAQLLERHMGGIEHDFRTASAIEAAVGGAQQAYAEQVRSRTGVAPGLYQIWREIPQALVHAAAGAAQLEHPVERSLDGLETAQAFNDIRDAFSTPVGRFGMTRAVLLGYVRRTTLGGGATGPTWRLIEPEDRCINCNTGPGEKSKTVDYYRIENDRDAPGTEVAHCVSCCRLVRCGTCRGVTVVVERQLDKLMHCQGGCGMQFCIETEPSQRGGYENPVVKIVAPGDGDGALSN